MPVTPVDLYRRALPGTNCKECGYPTCLAFAFAVVQEQKSLDLCPYIDPGVRAEIAAELDAQHEAGEHLKPDLAQDALAWARQRATSMRPSDLADRIGGRLVGEGEDARLELSYFTGTIQLRPDGLFHPDGAPLGHWEQVFVYNHLAQGGSSEPTGRWQGLVDIPNTSSKQKSMQAHVETPLAEHFAGRRAALLEAARAQGAVEASDRAESADLAVRFQPLPRVPVLLLFWDAEPEEGFEARIKLLFDTTITEHLDIESMMFLSETLRDRLLEAGPSG